MCGAHVTLARERPASGGALFRLQAAGLNVERRKKSWKTSIFMYLKLPSYDYLFTYVITELSAVTSNCRSYPRSGSGPQQSQCTSSKVTPQLGMNQLQKAVKMKPGATTAPSVFRSPSGCSNSPPNARQHSHLPFHPSHVI